MDIPLPLHTPLLLPTPLLPYMVIFYPSKRSLHHVLIQMALGGDGGGIIHLATEGMMIIKTIVRRLHGIYSLSSNALSAPDPVIRASSLCILMAIIVDISFQLPEQALRLMVSVYLWL